MIVTIVADVLGEENNGTTTACMNLVRYLKSIGDEVRIVCSDQDKKNLPGYYVVGNYNFGHIGNAIVARNNVALAKPDPEILNKAILDADIVHCMMPFGLARAAMRICKKNNIPVTSGFHVQAENVTCHIGMMNFQFANKEVYKNFWHKYYFGIDAIHYPTEFIKETFEEAVNKKTPAYVISNGVHDRFVKKDIEKPAELKGKFVILFSGRLCREKSHHILIKAIEYSKHKNDIQLIFAGQGPRKKRLLALAKNSGINTPIIKFFKKDELVDVINYCDLYCHPAEIEIEAISCLEAITCGLVPVISNSKRSATRFFALDEKNLFECNNYKELAEKIDYWIDNPDEKKKRSDEYLGYTKQFNQTRCMERMREMLVETINKKKC
ncbi:MAG: glycosyltransferase [Acholeplasmatales bacterium]|nr:glycosyltransferase [Acholeplasmatales bacterium]